MIELMKPYPLFRLVQEDVPDRENRPSSHMVYTVYVKTFEEGEWAKLYSTFSEPFAKIALSRLRDIFELTIVKWANGNEPTMIEVHDQVYKVSYVFPDQCCVCGKIIAGNHNYGEVVIDVIKFDFIKDIVFFYYKGDCLLKANQLFLDGELLLNSKQLKEVCDEIGQDMSYLDSSPDKLLKYIANNYDGAITYNCNGYSSFNIKDYK